MLEMEKDEKAPGCDFFTEVVDPGCEDLLMSVGEDGVVGVPGDPGARGDGGGDGIWLLSVTVTEALMVLTAPRSGTLSTVLAADCGGDGGDVGALRKDAGAEVRTRGKSSNPFLGLRGLTAAGVPFISGCGLEARGGDTGRNSGDPAGEALAGSTAEEGGLPLLPPLHSASPKHSTAVDEGMLSITGFVLLLLLLLLIAACRADSVSDSCMSMDSVIFSAASHDGGTHSH